MTVDEYVKDRALPLRDYFQQYVNLCAEDTSVCILKYEDMIADFPKWLEALLNYCQLEISSSLKHELIEKSNKGKQKKKEDISSHRRQVTPGDHARKLKPETIAYLNELFADVMGKFQYSIDVDVK